MELKNNAVKEIRGMFMPFSDDYGIVGFSYHCPECNHTSKLQSYCEECGFDESDDINPEDWYDNEMGKPVKKRRWNQ